MALSRFSWDNDEDFFDSMLQRSLAPLYNGPSRSTGSSDKDAVSRFYPKFDVIEKGNKSTVIVELPGLSKDKVNIALDNDRLTISGSSEEAKEYTDADKVTHKERSFGSFSRTMQVPPGTKAEDIKASMDQGLLKVELPNKKEDKSPKKITVN